MHHDRQIGRAKVAGDQRQIDAESAAGAGDARHRVFVRSADIADHMRLALVLPRLQGGDRQLRHMLVFIDLFAEQLARHVAALGQVAARFQPGAGTAGENAHVAIAQSFQGLPSPICARAALVIHGNRGGGIADQVGNALLDQAPRQESGAENMASVGFARLADVE